MTTIRATALVLRTITYGESDRVVTLLLRAGGKVGAMARGAQKSQKRFAGALELGTVLDVDLLSRPGRQLLAINRVDLLRSYLSLGRDVLTFAFASYALELVREFTPEREPDPVLFDLIAGYLEALSARGPDEGTLRLFELSLLGHLGYAPDLLRCRDCGKEIAGLSNFQPALGGLRCDACDPKGRGGVLLGHGTPQGLLALAREGAALLSELGGEEEAFTPKALPAPKTKPPDRVAREGGRLIGRYVEHLLGRQVKSLTFLEEISFS